MTCVKAIPFAMNVLIAIDTERIKARYPEPSRDLHSPTGLDHHSQIMIASGRRRILRGQATADLSFKAIPGDAVSFDGTALCVNSDDAVVIYGINHLSGDQVLRPVSINAQTRQYAAMPSVPDSSPPAQNSGICCSHCAKVVQAGREQYYVCIALYTQSPDGETQKLHGYYYWTPTITIG